MPFQFFNVDVRLAVIVIVIVIVNIDFVLAALVVFEFLDCHGNNILLYPV